MKMADSLSKVKEYFGYETLAEFGKDWRELSEADKRDLRRGIENGSLTY